MKKGLVKIMTEEMKEILDKLNKYDDYKYRNNNGIGYKEIEAWEIELLLNYITNLQKENNQHISDIQVLMNKKENLERLTKKLQKENEKIKQINEELKQSKLLNIEFQDMEQRLANYKSRNEKAFELLEKYKYTEVDDYAKVIEFYKKIKKTLQGGDE